MRKFRVAIGQGFSKSGRKKWKESGKSEREGEKGRRKEGGAGRDQGQTERRRR